jgi:hypothetical protein
MNAMNKCYLTFAAVLTSVVLLSGCSEDSTALKHKPENGHEELHVSHEANGDIREETKSADDLPQFLKGKPEDMIAIYASVPKYKALLESIPCYCGCGESAGHRDNYDCFIHDNKENGKIVWDDHGTKCGVCLETAFESIQKFNDGQSIKAIRHYIDEKYNKGFAKPTPTPMPKG